MGNNASTNGQQVKQEEQEEFPPLPWRGEVGDTWDTEALDELREEIYKFKLREDAGINSFNILLVGEVGAGKSSTFNSFESVFKMRITNRANAGFSTGVGSVTKQFRMYTIQHGDTKLKFKFCDTMGLEGDGIQQNNGFSVSDFCKIMDGHVSNGQELTGDIVPGVPGYIETPTLSDRMHCVVFVISAKEARVMNSKIKDKLRNLKIEAEKRMLLPYVILTKIDKLVEDLQSDPTKTFNSTKIRDLVDYINDEFGIVKNKICPVMNYESQDRTDKDIDILLLKAFTKIKSACEDYITDRFDN